MLDDGTSLQAGSNGRLQLLSREDVCITELTDSRGSPELHFAFILDGTATGGGPRLRAVASFE